MRADKLDVHNAEVVSDRDYEAIVIAFNVENDAAILQNACAFISAGCDHAECKTTATQAVSGSQASGYFNQNVLSVDTAMIRMSQL